MLLDDLYNETWPTDDLEHLGSCPVCNSANRHILFENLRDSVYRAAPGHWTLWKCEQCDVAYIDPRPTSGSISRAYTNYATHDPSDREFLGSNKGSSTDWVRQEIKKSYLNYAFKYSLPDALPRIIGALADILFLDQCQGANHSVRHLPPPPTRGARFLDVGCGNGSFLKIASSIGYDVAGLEPDVAAAQLAMESCKDIKIGSLPGSGFPPNSFSQITLSHVVEHLHRPKEALAEIFSLLKPGGRVWLSQPNLESTGFKEFGANWRGLEPPRHLVLFSPNSLVGLLNSLEFTGARMLQPAPTAIFYYKQSLAMAHNEDPNSRGAPSGWTKEDQMRAKNADKKAVINPSSGESFTIIAFKPPI